MCPSPVQTHSGKSHDSDGEITENSLPKLHVGLGKVGVETVEGAVAPIVFNHDVFAVGASARVFINMDNLTICDGSNLIEGVSLVVAFGGLNIEAFVKLGSR